MEGFVGDTSHAYAILSHTWGEEEVSLQQYSAPKARSMAGYHKIEHSCALAARSRLPYLWVDTCCIDKSSSAELSEAINSMYKWYRDAAVCYVYLSDMKRCKVYQNHSKDESFVSQNFQMLQGCRWFTRGWTLQELLAPEDVEFYDQDWGSIGTKKTMWGLLSRITGIKPEHLWRSQEASVAQKMSWAANRQTTRTEDIAYSLLGLFNVNMPLLYGEGEKAFKRLQHEILQLTNDESIFAWTDEEVWTSGLLAESPANFAKAGDVVPINRFYRMPYTMTNQGFQIELRHSNAENEEAGRFESPLRCTKESMLDHTIISLHMTYYTDGTGALRALRTGPFQVGMMINELLGDTEKSDTFHIDDFRCPKLPPHIGTPLYTVLPTDKNCSDSLTVRLSGGSYAEDICLFKNIGVPGVRGCFSIVDRSKASFAGGLNPIVPIMYVYWSQDGDPAYMTFKFRPLSSDSTQRPPSASSGSLSPFKLQAGNSLATWASADKMLFIAFLRPQRLEAYIDIQVNAIRGGMEGLFRLTKADPLRLYKHYPVVNLFPDSLETELPWTESSGKWMYGLEINGIGRGSP